MAPTVPRGVVPGGRGGRRRVPVTTGAGAAEPARVAQTEGEAAPEPLGVESREESVS